MAVVYIYLIYDHRQEQTALDVLKCLLKQLVRQSESVPPMLESAESNDSHLSAADISNIFVSCSKHFSKVFVVVDALDECDQMQREILVPFLQHLIQVGLKVFYTARPDLQSMFTANRVTHLEISAKETDLKMYLTERLERSDPKHEFDRNAIIMKIVSEAKGMYLSSQPPLPSSKY